MAKNNTSNVTVNNTSLNNKEENNMMNMTVKELKVVAKEIGVKNYSRMSKNELVKAISEKKAEHIQPTVEASVSNTEVVTREGNKLAQWMYFRKEVTKNFKLNGDKLVCTGLGTFYLANHLEGDLAKFNGKVYTCKLGNKIFRNNFKVKGILSIVSTSFKKRYGKNYSVTEEDINSFLDSLVKNKYISRTYVNPTNGSTKPVPVYMMSENMIKKLMIAG